MAKHEIAELMKKSKAELVRMLLEKEEISIPASVFSTKLGPLEALVYYLKEKKGLTVSEIAIRLNRHQQTIWTSYYKARKAHVTLNESGITIPLSIFLKQNLSIFESLSYYLKDILGMKYSEIAKLLHRDLKTIWTFHHRFEIKTHTNKNHNHGGKIK